MTTSPAAASPLRTPRPPWPWREWLLQLVLLALVVGVGYWLIDNTLTNLRQRGIATGFSFLNSTAGFGIGFHLIPYDETATYGRAFLVALLNTLLVSVVGILAATALGFLVGIASLSQNFLIRLLAVSYVEVLRNLPLLLQIFFWYFAVLATLPLPRQSLVLYDTFWLNNRGLYSPTPQFDGFTLSLLLLGAALALTAVIRLLWPKPVVAQARLRFTPPLWLRDAAVGMGLLGWGASRIVWETPELQGFNLRGGMAIPPEFAALTLALSTYTAAFIAEVVRSGINAVPKGQREAAKSLGLNGVQTMTLVIVPQAMRVIVPPLTSQYLNLAKNSSLAAAIAYPDLVMVFAGITLNQTGQAIEVIAITMAVYLTMSLSVSLLMDWYNRRVNIAER